MNVPSWLGKRALELSAFRLRLSPALEIEDQFRIALPELRQAWSATFPRLFG